MDPNTASIRVAIEGCGHGTLDDIYASVKHSAQLKDWPTVDLLIICGDFQANRNAQDLNTMSVPVKYRDMADFWKYYSGEKKAPYLTIFIGGNHEASGHMRELYYGGWIAPNIYYMGAANVLHLGSLRIAGLSGIWKGRDYRKGHFERLPFTQDEVRSFYHVREMDVRKLLQIRSQVDVGLSHDWPHGIEWLGNHKHLFKIKRGFEEDSRNGTLGSQAATYVLDWLRPPYWFSAHMHVRFTAVKTFKKALPAETKIEAETQVVGETKNDDEIDLDDDILDTGVAVLSKNDDEISLDLDDESEALAKTAPKTVIEDIRAQLPAAFAKPALRPQPKNLPHPPEITNTTTNFLALDKLVPEHHFLQLLEITPTNADPKASIERPLVFTYDPEWLAVTRVFNKHSPLESFPYDVGSEVYRPLIEKELAWVEENLVKKGKLTVPENFEITAPIHDPEKGDRVKGMPREYSSPQTRQYCELLDMHNWFHDEEANLIERYTNQPEEEESHSFHRGRGRGGRGGGRGFGGRGRGRGRGRFH